ncbi:MAG: hypothetical protein LLF84_06790 [Methanoregulaceae archaeon]|nr:hypothetical protein [Methanoregulaceae archaeon]
MGPITARSTSNLRNERVERLVNFALYIAVGADGFIYRRKSVGPEGFETEFDHIIKKANITLYGQTTCYKERGTDGGEPNKTYEMRETLMEYLLVFLQGLKENHLDFNDIRFFHVVVGDPTYSYSYFNDLRKIFYDLNVVANFEGGVQNFYDELEVLLPDSVMSDEDACYSILDRSYHSANPTLTKSAIVHISQKFNQYFSEKLPQGKIGIFREALNILAKSRLPEIAAHFYKNLAGAGIKEKYIRAAKDDASEDKRIEYVVKKIFTLRPFLPEAKKALRGGSTGWNNYVNTLFDHIPENADLSLAIEILWNPKSPGEREISRRLLIKIPGIISESEILYPQDIPIKGVTEHNLYGGDFDSKKIEIFQFIQKKFERAGIVTSKQLKESFVKFGRSPIKDGFEYDLQNGTVIRPTLYYLDYVLTQNGFTILTSKQALGTTIKGFHVDLFEINAGSFNSIGVIQKSNKSLALFKAKFFRPQEFDRRVKEEGFISFTSYFRIKEGKLILQFETLPRIMFIDTVEGWKPDRIALEQLYLMGWDIFFDIDELIQYLEKIHNSFNKPMKTS